MAFDNQLQQIKTLRSIGKNTNAKWSSSKYVGRLQNRKSDKKGGSDMSTMSSISQNSLNIVGSLNGNVRWNNLACMNKTVATYKERKTVICCWNELDMN